MAHVAQPGGGGPEQIFWRSSARDPGAPPVEEHQQHPEEERGVQQEGGCRTGSGDDEATEGRPDGLGQVEPGDVQRNRG